MEAHSPHHVGQGERLTEIARISWRLAPKLGDQAIELSLHAGDLSDCLRESHCALLAVVSRDADDRTLATMARLRDVALRGLQSAQPATPLTPAEFDAGVSSWLADRNLSSEVTLSPAFVQARLGEAFLDEVLSAVGETTFMAVLLWLSLAVETELLHGQLEKCLQWIASRLRSREDEQLHAADEAALIGLHDLLTNTVDRLHEHGHACVRSLPRSTEVGVGLG